MPAGRTAALARVATAELLVMSVWFSASAIAPTLSDHWALSSGQIAALAIAVQAGFVLGAIGLTVSGAAASLRPKHLFVISGTVALLANASMVMLGPGSWLVVLLSRVVTGAALAGVYPSGLSALAGWFAASRGTALGVLVAALTIGTAVPHLIGSVAMPWQGVILASSLLALLGVVIMGGLEPGPHVAEPVRFSAGDLGHVLRNRGFRLSTVGYLGHMWELYAMWAWVGAFIAASGMAARSRYGSVPLITFVVIAVGGLGAALAGRVSDSYGRPLAAAGALVVSGSAVLSTPLVFGAPVAVLLLVLGLWGFGVVADSAQFSVMATEPVRPEARSTALILQTAAGFLLALVTVRLVPAAAGLLGWRWAFLILAPGPMVALIAVARYARSSRPREHHGAEAYARI